MLETLKRMNWGDFLFYIDSGDTMLKGTKNFINKKVLEGRSSIISTSFFIQKDFTKRDCFIAMGCDQQKYWDAYQVEAGIIGFLKNEQNILFLEEWLKYCKDKNIITDIPNELGFKNFDSFIDHRHDQSILTNLCTKYDIKLTNGIRKYAGVNIQDIMNYPVDNV